MAVAAGVVAFALDTDTAGSGQVPAAHNGIVGLKPTRWIISSAGVVPACRSLDCVSVFASDLDDAQLVLSVLAGPDRPTRGRACRKPRHGVAKTETRHSKSWGCSLASEALADPGFAEAFRRVVEPLDTRPVPLEPLFEAGDLLYDGPWVAERLAGLADFLAEHPDDVLPVTRAVITRDADGRARRPPRDAARPAGARPHPAARA